MLLDGVVIAAEVRVVARSGPSDMWQIELLDEMPANERPAPFTSQWQPSSRIRPRWNGSASKRPRRDEPDLEPAYGNRHSCRARHGCAPASDSRIGIRV